jgi:hypothetical protein
MGAPAVAFVPAPTLHLIEIIRGGVKTMEPAWPTPVEVK